MSFSLTETQQRCLAALLLYDHPIRPGQVPGGHALGNSNALKALCRIGLARESSTRGPNRHIVYRYAATDAGVNEFIESMGPEFAAKLKKKKQKAGELGQALAKVKVAFIMEAIEEHTKAAGKEK